MNYTYRLRPEADIVLRIEDETFIPFDPANTAYQEYLEWLSEGNTPLSAEPLDPAE